MKKLLSAAVVMAMVSALSVSAFASTTVADNGSDVKFDVPKANVTPVMDGVINPGEYSEIATTEADWCIGTPNDDWDDAAWTLAKTAKVYMSWDENYIYYASTFTAPFGFYCPWEDEPGSIWYSGCMQMAYSSLEDHNDATSNHWEDGVGKAENGNKVYVSYGTPEGYDQTDEETLAGLFDFTINGNDVVFEHRVPYQAFAPGAFAEGQQYGMCAVYSIGQDQDYLHVQLSGGVSGGKDQSMNAVITLKPAPVIELEGNATAIWDFGETDAGIKDFNTMDMALNGDYATFTASGNDPYGYIDMNVADVNTMQWAKIRVRNTSAVKAIELFAKTDGDGHALSGPECTHLYMLPDTANWNTYIIYLPNANIYTSTNVKGTALDAWNWQGALSQIRLDAMWNEGDGGTDGCSIDIDYIAFFSSKADAEAFRAGQDYNTQVSFESSTDYPAYMNVAEPAAAEAAPAPAAEAAPAPVAEAAPAAAPVAAAAPAAPAAAAQTSDASAVIVLAAVAALGTAVVVSKKH